MSNFHGEATNFRGAMSNFRGEATNFRGAMSNFRGEATNFRGEATGNRRETTNYWAVRQKKLFQCGDKVSASDSGSLRHSHFFHNTPADTRPISVRAATETKLLFSHNQSMTLKRMSGQAASKNAFLFLPRKKGTRHRFTKPIT